MVKMFGILFVSVILTGCGAMSKPEIHTDVKTLDMGDGVVRKVSAIKTANQDGAQQNAIAFWDCPTEAQMKMGQICKIAESGGRPLVSFTSGTGLTKDLVHAVLGNAVQGGMGVWAAHEFGASIRPDRNSTSINTVADSSGTTAVSGSSAFANSFSSAYQSQGQSSFMSQGQGQSQGQTNFNPTNLNTYNPNSNNFHNNPRNSPYTRFQNFNLNQ